MNTPWVFDISHEKISWDKKIADQIYAKRKDYDSSINNFREGISFEVKRYYQDDSTEFLVIKGSDNRTPDENNRGEIKTSITKIQQEIEQFKEHGIVMPHVDYMDIAQLIENEYMKLDRVESKNVQTSTDKIVEMIADYIKESEMAPYKGLYCIPVDEFRDFIEDNSAIQGWSYKYLRKELWNNGFTKCNTGRTDYTVCIDKKSNKRIKSIAFKVESLQKDSTNNDKKS